MRLERSYLIWQMAKYWWHQVDQVHWCGMRWSQIAVSEWERKRKMGKTKHSLFLWEMWLKKEEERQSGTYSGIKDLTFVFFFFSFFPFLFSFVLLFLMLERLKLNYRLWGRHLPRKARGELIDGIRSYKGKYQEHETWDVTTFSITENVSVRISLRYI